MSHRFAWWRPRSDLPPFNHMGGSIGLQDMVLDRIQWISLHMASFGLVDCLPTAVRHQPLPAPGSAQESSLSPPGPSRARRSHADSEMRNPNAWGLGSSQIASLRSQGSGQEGPIEPWRHDCSATQTEKISPVVAGSAAWDHRAIPGVALQSRNQAPHPEAGASVPADEWAAVRSRRRRCFGTFVDRNPGALSEILRPAPRLQLRDRCVHPRSPACARRPEWPGPNPGRCLPDPVQACPATVRGS